MGPSRYFIQGGWELILVLNRSPDSVEVHGGEPLSPLEMEEIDAELQELQATTAEAASLGQTDVTAFRTWSDKKNCLPNEELFMGLCYKKCSLLSVLKRPMMIR